MSLRDWFISKLGKRQNLLHTALGFFGYKRFLEDDFISNLKAWRSQGLLEDDVADAAMKALADKSLKPVVTCLDEIVSGSTLRGRGAMYRVDWDINGINVSSFVNIYDSRARAKNAYLGQSYFQHVLEAARSVKPETDMPQTRVLVPRANISANLVSNVLLNARTLNDIAQTEYSDELLLTLARDFKRFFDYSLTHEETAFVQMNRRGLRVNAHTFKFADYTQEFLEKFVYRVEPSAKSLVTKSLTTFSSSDEHLNGLLSLFTDGISGHFLEKKHAISHRDPILSNVLRDKNSKQYLIDFECTARDTIESWITPLLFKAGSRELEDKIIEIAGITRQDAEIAKARDNLLWVGRLIEFSNMPNVENKSELEFAANYRFTLAIQSLKEAGLFRLSDAVSTYFIGKLRELDERTMSKTRLTHDPSNRLVSIVNCDPKYDNLLQLRAAFKVRRLVRNTLYSAAALGVLVGGYLALDNKTQIDGNNQKFAMQVSLQQEFADTAYKSRQRFVFDCARDYCLDNPDKVTRFGIYSEKVSQVATKYGLDLQLVRNILQANRVAGGIDNMKSQFKIETVNVFDVFTATEGIPNNLMDPMENFENGAKRLSDLIKLHNNDTNAALAQFYNPFGTDGRYLGSSVSNPLEVVTIAKHVRTMVWNALHGRYDGNLDVALGSPDTEFKIKMDVPLGQFNGNYRIEVAGDSTVSLGGVKIKVLSYEKLNSSSNFFLNLDSKYLGGK